MSTSNENKPQIPSGPFLGQLAGMAEARAWGEALAQDIGLYRAGRLDWAEIDAGCVLHGPPGTGKSTFARALAASAKVPLIATSYADWNRGTRYAADIINAIQRTFELADKHRPCVLAIDELDSLPSRATLPPDHPGLHMVINAMLEQLDGLNKRSGVVVIGTCNHPDRLDPALVRPGRLGKLVHIPLPDLGALPKILAFHLKDDASRIGNLPGIAVQCRGMSGAAIEQLVREARARARRAGHGLRRDDLTAILDAKVARFDPATQRRLAIHEAGHGVAALRAGTSANVTLSLVGSGDSLASTWYSRRDVPTTRQTIAQHLVILLAGRAAEELMTGEISGLSGGNDSSDIASATRLAYEAVGSLGLSQTGSLLWFGNHHLPAALVAEAKGMLDDAYEEAKTLIANELQYVERVAEALVKARALSHDELIALDDRKPNPIVSAAVQAWGGFRPGVGVLGPLAEIAPSRLTRRRRFAQATEGRPS